MPCAMLRAGMQALRRDPILIIVAVAVTALSAVSFILPVPKPVVEAIGWWSDFPLLALTILATWRASAHERTTWGRRFWKLVTIGLGLWFVVLLQWQFSWGENLPLHGDVLGDFLFLGYYFALLLATAVKPHERSGSTRLSPILLAEVAAGALLAFGMLAYFVILPSRITPASYETYVPSLSLYVLLDLVLVGRVAWWCHTTRGSSWRTVYCALAAGFGFTLLHDIHELVVYTEGNTLQVSPWDLVWWAQFLCLVLAARASRHSAPLRGAEADQPEFSADAGRQAILGPVASYAFILPVIHLGGRVSGVLDPVLDKPRETLVLACAVVLGLLAVLHQELMNRRYRVVSQNLHDAQILLQQSRKMEALGRLAGGVAHGFNNLLSVIVGYTEILMERVGPGDAALEPLQQIRFAAERAATLTRQLATFGRGRLDQEVSLGLDRAVEALLPTMQRLLTDRVTLTFAPGAGGAWIQVDPDQFERALLNIVANARDALHDGGTVKVATRALILADGESSTLGLLPPGRYVEVAVTDSGAGMDDEVRSRLFEPFFTTRHAEGRKGLGLATVYGVVRQASGHIEVDSRPGAGTTVRLYLPRRQPPVEVKREAEAPPPVDRRCTVLLAEDERGLRRLIRSALELEGLVVLEAADGGAAVDVAENHPGTIDLLVSDVVMPVFGGPEVARRVLAGRPETRVLFISGYAPETLGDLHVRGTETSLLPKPFTMTDLVAKVRALLPARAGRPPGARAGGPDLPRGSEVTT
jgi:signal transduction histidine kinase/CheY-like chemotaxis protein